MFSSSADVAAPRILQELRGRRRRKLLVPPVPLVEPRQEALSEDEDLLLALPQRRNANLHDVEAVVEVFTELAAGERLLEIAIGRRHDPGVHVDHPVASDAGEAEVLQDVQELDAYVRYPHEPEPNSNCLAMVPRARNAYNPRRWPWWLRQAGVRTYAKV